MLKRIIPILIIFGFAGYVYGDVEKVPAEAKILFEKGLYSQGLDTLMQGLRDDDITPLKRAYIIEAMAEFYDETVGDIRKASGFCRQVVRAPIAADDPVKVRAQGRLSKLQALQTECKEQDKQLRGIRNKSSRRSSPDKVAEQIKQLLAMVSENPDYYRLAELYYYLGTNYHAAEEYKKAFETFNKALQLKPGIDFQLPVTPGVHGAHKKWIRANITKTAWGIIGAMLVIGAIGFYVSCPWRWMRLRHAGICVGGVLLWVVLFGISYKWIGQTYTATDKMVKEINVQAPAFIKAAPASPGSEIMKAFFVYGLIGAVGVCVFSIATSRFKHKTAALLVNIAVGVLLMSSITTIFYLRHCVSSRFGSPTEGGLYYAKSAVCFLLHDSEPFILTVPKAYPNLDLGNLGGDDFGNWIKEHCPFDEEEKQ